MKVSGSHQIDRVQLKELSVTNHGNTKLSAHFAMPLLQGHPAVTIKATLTSDGVSDKTIQLLYQLVSSLERDMAEKVFSLEAEEETPEVKQL